MAVLVYSTSNAKKFRGGVIAVRCADFLGAARGTLTTESDPLSAGGTVVRDTQQVDDLYVDPLATSYAAADDTLVLTGLAVVPLRSYEIYISYRIGGEWDFTDDAFLRAQRSEDWSAGYMAFHGNTVSSSSPQGSGHSAPPLPHYRMMFLGSFTAESTPEDMTIRVYSELGTTVE